MANVDSAVTAKEINFVLDLSLKGTGLAYISELLAKLYAARGKHFLVACVKSVGCTRQLWADNIHEQEAGP
ncbi:hypothetical protein [Buttiauxella gaviniae]|uniref:hypothetical protein n=1 Tax=Buttiauxella gaviniae TaxID=82990 RepID=UPI0039AEFB9D